MDKFLKQFKNLKSGNKGPSESMDYQKYGIFFGTVFTYSIFIPPKMKKYYNKLFSNDADITHVVNNFLIKVLF
jgi:hypothetical protein